jgi:hypothetical protein
MKKTRKARGDAEMLEEYDFSKGVRGRYAERYAAGSNIIVLAPDLARIFPDSQSVNQALHSLVAIARKSTKGARPR